MALISTQSIRILPFFHVTKERDRLLLFVGLIGLVHHQNSAVFDPSPLQDFCVATSDSGVFVNGDPCKDPKMVTDNDFFFSSLDKAGHTSNVFSLAVTPVTVAKIPGLNTLGISVARIDYGAFGLNPPHTHPRGTEILYVAEGTLQVGFITSNPNNTLISKVLQKGNVFVFPVGLIHYEWNVGNKNAVAIVALSSQKPGVISIANAVFGSEPNISSAVLAKSFQIPTPVVDQIMSKS